MLGRGALALASLVAAACSDEPGRSGEDPPGGADGGARSDAAAGPDLGGWFDGAVGPDVPLDPNHPSDRDGDGLEDRIDPEPDRPNPLLFFDDFSALSPRWSFTSVSMAIDVGRRLLAVDALEPFEREGWIGPQPSWSDYLVQARLRLLSVGSSDRSGAGQAAVLIRVEQLTPSRYISCGLDRRRGRSVLLEHRGAEVRVLDEGPAPANPSDWVVVTLLARGARYACDVSSVSLSGSSDRLVGGSVGFRSEDATFEADWLRVYDVF